MHAGLAFRSGAVEVSVLLGCSMPNFQRQRSGLNFKVRKSKFIHISSLEVYIHVSVHRNSILIRSNKMQQYAGFIYCKITLHVSDIYRTHYQEYIKL